jgi:hypothetical protein
MVDPPLAQEATASAPWRTALMSKPERTLVVTPRNLPTGPWRGDGSHRDAPTPVRTAWTSRRGALASLGGAAGAFRRAVDGSRGSLETVDRRNTGWTPNGKTSAPTRGTGFEQSP